MTDQSTEASPKRTARLAGGFYFLTIVTGAGALMVASGRAALSLAASACYVMVTVLFYGLFKPVHKGLSLIAAIISLWGCVIGALAAFHLDPLHVNSLAFFGAYCLLIGYLIFRSSFLPRVLGVLMAIGGLGWLTFASPALADRLSPYNMFPGVIGETALTLWLLVLGVNVQRWNARARATGSQRRASS